MKSKKRNLASEIIDDLEKLATALESNTPLQRFFTVRTVRAIPKPSAYTGKTVRSARQLIGVSQPIFAQMLGVSPALVRSWEIGQRKPSPLARRMLDLIRENPARWRKMVDAA
jgi:putative transcriptional regulator